MSTYRANTDATLLKLLGSAWDRRPEIIDRIPPFLIRTASLEDAKALADLLTISFHDQDSWMKYFTPLLRIGIYEDLRHRIRSRISPYACVIATYISDAERSSEAAVSLRSDFDGNAESLPEADEPSRPSSGVTPPIIVGTVEMTVKQRLWGCTRSKYVYLSNLATRPDYRRRGVAGHVLRGCETIAQRWGYRDLYLHVLDDNAGARLLYQKLGYQIRQSDADLVTWLLNRPRQLLLHKHLQNTPSAQE